MESSSIVLQKVRMSLVDRFRRKHFWSIFPSSVLAGLGATLIALPPLFAQSITANPSTQASPNQASQPQVTQSPKGKEDEAARAAARAKARHFDRVLIIVLENVDYERASS